MLLPTHRSIMTVEHRHAVNTFYLLVFQAEQSSTVDVTVVYFIKVSNENYILELLRSQRRKIQEIAYLQTTQKSESGLPSSKQNKIQPSSAVIKLNVCSFHLRMAYFRPLKEELTLPLQTRTSLRKKL